MPSIAVNSAGKVFVTAQASDDNVVFGGLRTIGMQLDPGDTIFQQWFPIRECQKSCVSDVVLHAGASPRRERSTHGNHGRHGVHARA